MASLIQLLLGRLFTPSAHEGMYGIWLDSRVTFSVHLFFFLLLPVKCYTLVSISWSRWNYISIPLPSTDQA
jgi:hypothetical protein